MPSLLSASVVNQNYIWFLERRGEEMGGQQALNRKELYNEENNKLQVAKNFSEHIKCASINH